MSRFVILLGGDLTLTPQVRRLVRGARTIAADSGIRHAAKLGLVPELWVGDFDSVSDATIAEWPSIPREVFPARKDKTDGELAIERAITRGATDLLLVGGFGGDRADHAFLHMTLALRLAESGLGVRLLSGDQEGQPILAGSTTYAHPVGTLFSVLGFTELAGLTVEGARWPLDRVAVPFGSSLTISNEVTGTLAIGLESGRAILIAHSAEPELR